MPRTCSWAIATRRLLRQYPPLPEYGADAKAADVDHTARRFEKTVVGALETLVRERPDLAAPIDTVARMGPHVLMEIPEADWELLQHEKDAVPDALANRLMRGQASEDVGSDLVRFRQEQYAAHPALMGGRAQTQG